MDDELTALKHNSTWILTNLPSGNNFQESTSIKIFLNTNFKIKDLGTLKYFLGLEVARSSRGTHICQCKYTLDLLSDTGLLGEKPTSTHMPNGTKLLKDYGTLLADRALFRRLCFLGLEVARSSRGIHICQCKYALDLLSDTCLLATKPTSTHMPNGTKLLKDYGTLLIDRVVFRSQIAWHIAANSSCHECTKHIDLDCHIVRKKLQQKLIDLLPISFVQQLADVFTIQPRFTFLCPSWIYLAYVL
ncbi:uncharacterized protein [Cicer arietinum]|uniref:uncharacterized protein n=1 Tax=Cicer arietinum TaxID=3827 RepID=UPI003CC502C0